MQNLQENIDTIFSR